MALDALGQTVVAAKAYVVVGLACPTIGSNRVTLVFGDRNDQKLVVRADQIFNQTDFLGAILATGNLVWAALAHAHLSADLPQLKWKNAICRTTANVNLASGLANGTTHDGVTVSTGDIVAVLAQSTASQNGLYVVPPSGAASRCVDADSDVELRGMVCLVAQGTTYKRTIWINTNATAITVGSTSVTFANLNQHFGLGTLAFQNDLDVNQLVDVAVGGAGDDGAILYWRSGTVRSSDPPPGSNYAPYWDGSQISWMAVSP